METELKSGISIIICTYNGKSRLADTLKHIVAQEFHCPLELILVDNASQDDTREFSDQWWKKNGIKKIAYSSYKQPILGKSYAQQLGYSKAKYTYLLMCDDDNWLSKNYVQDAYDIINTDTRIGALGGWCEAVFADQEPEWFTSYAKYFAVAKQGTQNGDITNKKGCLYGAGMVIRKSHWEQLNKLGFQPLLTCRKGKTLSSGGDTEYCYVLRLLGYKIWYDERLYFKHYMTKGRMSLQYVSNIRKAMSHSNFVVSVYVDKLHGRMLTSTDFQKKFVNQFTKFFIKNLIKRVVGTYEQKENAKRYFRNIRRLLFSYKAYKSNYKSISTWLPQDNS